MSIDIQNNTIRGPANAWIFNALVQNLIHRPGHWFFAGCHTNQDTKTLIESSGFSFLELETFRAHSPFTPQIRGKAIK